MANSNVQYDFTHNRLAVRLRVMGIVLLLAGVLYAFLAYLMYGLDAGYSTGPDEAAMTGDALIMVIGVMLVILSVLMLIVPSKPGLGRPTSILAIVLTVVCVASFLFLMAIGDSGMLMRACAIIGIPVALSVHSLINQGKDS
jgi:hypothetical protein